MIQNYQHASYLRDAIPTNQRTIAVNRVLKMIRAEMRRGLKFDSIAFSGMSGALVAPIVAMRLKKETILIRKPDDGSHSYHDNRRIFEGYRECRRYIIVDDFIFYGETVRRIRIGVKGTAETAKLVGVALYNSGHSFVTKYNDK